MSFIPPHNNAILNQINSIFKHNPHKKSQPNSNHTNFYPYYLHDRGVFQVPNIPNYIKSTTNKNKASEPISNP